MESKRAGGLTSRLRVGDRVRLNELGSSRAPKMRAKSGVVVKLPKRASGGGTVEVLFDGNRTPTRLHLSYIEHCSGEPERPRSDGTGPRNGPLVSQA